MPVKKTTKKTLSKRGVKAKKTVKKVVRKNVKSGVRKKTTKKITKNKIDRKTIRKIVLKKKGCCKKKCKPENAFWVNNGPVVDSVDGLLEALKTMSDEQYEYHTKRNGNDFARWLDECICNKDFASRIRRVRSRLGAIKALSVK